MKSLGPRIASPNGIIFSMDPGHKYPRPKDTYSLLMNHIVIVFNMLSGERIKAHWASCFQGSDKAINLTSFPYKIKISTIHIK